MNIGLGVISILKLALSAKQVIPRCKQSTLVHWICTVWLQQIVKVTLQKFLDNIALPGNVWLEICHAIQEVRNKFQVFLPKWSSAYVNRLWFFASSLTSTAPNTTTYEVQLLLINVSDCWRIAYHPDCGVSGEEKIGHSIHTKPAKDKTVAWTLVLIVTNNNWRSTAYIYLDISRM